jgi:hypothetical protein
MGGGGLLQDTVSPMGDMVHFIFSYLKIYFYAPLRRRGAYCFGLVGRYVGRSVDQTLSAQYLENLPSDCYDISYVGW